MADKKVLTRDDIEVGDTVQIVAGAVCVTNGVVSKAGGYYVEGGSLWATISSITDNWQTGSLFGLPAKVTKVRLVNQGVAVWDVQPKDIATNIIKKNPPKEEKKKTATKKKKTTPTPKPVDPLANVTSNPRQHVRMDIPTTNEPYSPKKGKQDWTKGSITYGRDNSNAVNSDTLKYGKISESALVDGAEKQTPVYYGVAQFNPNSRSSKVRKFWNLLPTSVKEDSLLTQPTPMYADFKTSWQSEGRKKEMLNKVPSLIQNEYKFPFLSEEEANKNDNKPSLYDYQIILDDPRLTKSKKSTPLEDKLMKARAQLGIPVHGNSKLARSMKFYTYNRWKTPDTNLAHNKSFTYVFFTRPDLNLLQPQGNSFTITDQIANHTEAALLWKQQPELFKMLTDRSRCGDANNFNLLLCNQVTSFELTDETLNTNEFGKSWNGYTMKYGDQYQGRASGEFSCNFTETSEYSIIKLMKLWITYIDNVSRGAWHPSYNLRNRAYTKDAPMNYNDSHVFTKTLDYASSVYVFKCAPDGETVLYWSSYHGIFPLNTAANTLSWDLTSPVGDGPKPTIRFAYSWKRDMNPISLIEFNGASEITKSKSGYLPAWDRANAAPSRPYVGAPYIEMDLGTPILTPNGVASYKDTTIRLKFKKDINTSRSDTVLYRNVYKHGVDSNYDGVHWVWTDEENGIGYWSTKSEGGNN